VNDTIAAIATAPGIAGIGVVRVSGPLATAIEQRVLGRALTPRQATLARFRDDQGATIDRGIAIAFRGPHSFTGEDVLELHGHGGRAVLDLLLGACIAAGARIARPGEFTERAYLNDKMDLAQAEAVADLIGASSATQARAALRSLEGVFSREVNALAEDLLKLRVFVEAALDFPDEEIEFLAQGQIGAKLAAIHEKLSALKHRAERGTRLTDGLRVAIVGRPNVGKSSLLNALSERDSAIVTPIAGTTRDVLREDISLDGIPLKLVDTAGLRESGDLIEIEGMRRAHAEIAHADLILHVRDATAPDAADPIKAPAGTPLLTVWNKIDLLREAPSLCAQDVAISALTGSGLERLREAIRQQAGLGGTLDGDFSARRRHLDALARCARALSQAQAQFASLSGTELLAEELKIAHQALGQITGTVSADALLGEIFSSFCIGK